MKILELFTWPIAVVILGVFALLLFKRPLVSLLERTKSFGKEGWQSLEAGAKVAPQSAAALPTEPRVLAIPSESAVVSGFEVAIRNDLAARQFADAAEREAYVIRLAAEAQRAMLFEYFYSLIYGSQLAVVQLLNSGPQDVAALEPFYQRGKEVAPHVYETYSFHQWLAWMEITAQLIRRNGDAVEVSMLGREFLKYIVGRGYSLFKQN